jgi:putative component of membrane protein insertase Oxa1/YidC/SpoIIIJ protein YidD
MKFSLSVCGRFLAFFALSATNVLADSSKDTALEACRLHPACSTQEVMATCKGDPKCIVDLTNKRTAKTTKFAEDVTDKAAKGMNDAAKETSKSIKKLFK